MKIPILVSLFLLLSSALFADVQLYVVDTEEGPGLVEFREDSLKVFGYKSEEPDLVVKELSHAYITESPLYAPPENTEDQGKKIYHLSIGWTDSDADRFHQLTKKSLRKRIMIVVDGTAVAAPTIMDEISTPSVWVTFREFEEAERILQYLKPLAKESSENQSAHTTPASAPR